jgi:hypothetical protein
VHPLLNYLILGSIRLLIGEVSSLIFHKAWADFQLQAFLFSHAGEGSEASRREYFLWQL